MQYDQVITADRLRRQASGKTSSDEALIRAMSTGDKNAMRVLYARHHVRVFRFLLRFVGNDTAAEDLLSEVFVEVWRQAGRFEARSQVTTWILGIARYKALTALRQRSFAALDDNAAELIADPADDPEVAAQKNDRSAILRDCLAQLSPAHREVIDLIYYHERSIEEVARIVGVPPNTVKTRAFHARKRIAELMAERGIARTGI